MDIYALQRHYDDECGYSSTETLMVFTNKAVAELVVEYMERGRKKKLRQYGGVWLQNTIFQIATLPLCEAKSETRVPSIVDQLFRKEV